MSLYLFAGTALAFIAGATVQSYATVFEKQDFKKSGSFLCEIISGDMKCEPIFLPDNHVSELNYDSQLCDHHDLVYGACS